MYEVQWFKLEKNIFCNRKIQLLLGLNDGDTYFRIWIQLLSLAVECGDGGRLIIGNNPISIKESRVITHISIIISFKSNEDSVII